MDETFDLPTDWQEAQQAIRQAMTEEDSSVARLLDTAEQSRVISYSELRRVLEHTVERVDRGLAGAELLLALARLGSVPRVFEPFPTAWERCAVVAARNPHNFGERSRILQEDLLYNYYLRVLKERLAKSGFDGFLQALRETRFLRDDEMGRQVGQNALLNILGWDLVTDPAQLEELGKECAEMPALQRKLRKLIGQHP